VQTKGSANKLILTEIYLILKHQSIVIGKQKGNTLPQFKQCKYVNAIQKGL